MPLEESPPAIVPWNELQSGKLEEEEEEEERKTPAIT